VKRAGFHCGLCGVPAGAAKQLPSVIRE
jgi:hypothetical protein